MKTNRIGVFSGTFDPVHRGHVEACLTAKGALELDEVLLLLEHQPHRKVNVTSPAHRQAMLRLATKSYASLKVVDWPQPHVTTTNTLDFLRANYPSSDYWMIMGSDMVEHLPDWSGVSELVGNFSLAVVLRDNAEQAVTEQRLAKLAKDYPGLHCELLPAVWSAVSSSRVRQGGGAARDGLDPAVAAYITKHHLYK